MLSFLKEFFDFLKERKKYWLHEDGGGEGKQQKNKLEEEHMLIHITYRETHHL